MIDWEKELEEILKDFEGELDRCRGNYKYNRKPVIKRLVKLLTKERQKISKALRMKEKEGGCEGWSLHNEGICDLCGRPMRGHKKLDYNQAVKENNQKLDSYLIKEGGEGV